MAYSDWNIVRKTYSSSGTHMVPQLSISGEPVPGENARKYFYYDSTPGQGEVDCYIQTKAHITGSNSEYIDLPHNTAISVRAKLKVNDFATNDNPGYDNRRLNCSIGLNVYSKQITSTSSSTGYGGGYNLCLVRKLLETTSSPDSYTNELVIRAASDLQSGQYGWDSSKDVVVCTGTYLSNTWYDVRFDVIPTTLSDKNLIAYTSVDDGVTWTQVGSYSVNIGQVTQWSSNIGAYIGYESGCFIRFAGAPLNMTNNAETYIKDFKLNIDPINFNP